MNLILCTTADALEERGLLNEGITKWPKDKSDLFDFLPYMFADRAYVENKPIFKQIIPYCVFIDKINNYKITPSTNVLIYKRSTKGGETRLYNNWSIGIGGHINLEDFDHPYKNHPDKFYKTLINGLRREIEEELEVYDGNINENYKIFNTNCFIYSEANDVCKVHWGVLFIGVLKDLRIIPKNEECTELKWMSLEELNDVEDLEIWSRLVVDYFLKRVEEQI